LSNLGTHCNAVVILMLCCLAACPMYMADVHEFLSFYTCANTLDIQSPKTPLDGTKKTFDSRRRPHCRLQHMKRWQLVACRWFHVSMRDPGCTKMAIDAPPLEHPLNHGRASIGSERRCAPAEPTVAMRIPIACDLPTCSVWRDGFCWR
jgi:hypothetical protein